MTQHRKFNIRSPEQLLPDREHRLSTRRRAAAQVFGMYLPLMTDIEAPLEVAVKESTQHLARVRRGPSAPLNPNDFFGMTFAERRHVNRNMTNMLGQGFVLKHLIEHLQDSPVAVGAASIEVPITGFAWKGAGNRKLAANLDADSVAFRTLCAQTVEIDSVLNQVRGTNSVEVALPDHVTVAAYGHPGDGMSLSRRHRGEVAELFHDVFLTHNNDAPLTLTLGSLVVGEHYKKPFDGMDLVPMLPAHTELTFDDDVFEDLEFPLALVSYIQ